LVLQAHLQVQTLVVVVVVFQALGLEVYSL
jgi:hypothetical protein